MPPKFGKFNFDGNPHDWKDEGDEPEKPKDLDPNADPDGVGWRL